MITSCLDRNGGGKRASKSMRWVPPEVTSHKTNSALTCAQHDFHAPEPNHSEEILDVVLVARDQPAEPLQPGVLLGGWPGLRPERPARTAGCPVLSRFGRVQSLSATTTLAGAGDLDSSSSHAGLNPSADSAAFCNSQVVIILKIEPELCGQAEVLPQANGSVGTDGPVSADNFIDAGEIEGLRQRKIAVRYPRTAGPFDSAQGRLGRLSIRDFRGLRGSGRQRRFLIWPWGLRSYMARESCAAVTTILAGLRERGFLRITISISRSRAFRKCIRRSTEKPCNW